MFPGAALTFLYKTVSQGASFEGPPTSDLFWSFKWSLFPHQSKPGLHSGETMNTFIPWGRESTTGAWQGLHIALYRVWPHIRYQKDSFGLFVSFSQPQQPGLWSGFLLEQQGSNRCADQIISDEMLSHSRCHGQQNHSQREGSEHRHQINLNTADQY